MSDFGNNSLKQYLKTNIKSKKWKMIEAKVLRLKICTSAPIATNPC